MEASKKELMLNRQIIIPIFFFVRYRFQHPEQNHLFLVVKDYLQVFFSFKFR